MPLQELEPLHSRYTEVAGGNKGLECASSEVGAIEEDSHGKFIRSVSGRAMPWIYGTKLMDKNTEIRIKVHEDFVGSIRSTSSIEQ